ncbi:MAG: hypothetical protein EA397_02410 [Deltaproteobacteria bacterium]|nr:MAG: hypothetical protein EA397_02410 [Deltaproteobacteria bacterium]
MPRWLILTVDLAYLLALAVLVGLPLAGAGILFDLLHQPLGVWRWATVPPLALGVLLGLLLEVALLHRVLPKPRPGQHALPSFDAAMWLVRFWLQRVVHQAAWREIVMGSVVLRTLALSALGGKVALTANLSSDAAITEAYLVRIGSGALVGTGAIVSAHLFVGGRLILAPVHIAQGAQIFGRAALGPGCTVGPGATVGFGANLGPNSTLEGGAVLGTGAIAVRDVSVGENAIIGEGAILLRGARVGAGEVVAAGQVVSAAPSDV